MEYLHSLHIVHRDVKPENILYVVDKGTDIKLIDFGYAGMWAADKPLTGLCGTPDYVAPEVLTWYDDDEHGTPYGKGSDLWSLGVLLYVILSGCSPFCADEEEALLKQVAQAKYEFFENEWKGISEEAKNLISRCAEPTLHTEGPCPRTGHPFRHGRARARRRLLVVDPDKRMTMAQLMEHPWCVAQPHALARWAEARAACVL